MSQAGGRPPMGYGGMPAPPGQRPPLSASRSQSPLRAPPGERDEFSLEQLEKLDKMMLVVCVLGLIINVVQIMAISNNAWLTGTAMYDGQPFNAYLSLGSATFGNATHPSKDNKYFCSAYETECSLRKLCSKTVPNNEFPNGLPRHTPQEDWCKVMGAGSLATRFLFFGLLLGLGATFFTGMYSAQAIPWVADQFDQIEELGFDDTLQKYIILFGWAALWLFVFCSMMTYALTIPDSLGWGGVELEASFGSLRVCFVLVSVQCALVANSCFHLWPDDALASFWTGFMETKWLSFKKALYFELVLQLLAYFLLTVVEMDWASMLNVLAFIYLAGGDRTFMLMYVCFIVVSILFDIIELAGLPALGTMTSGEIFGTWVWIVIFALKPIIVGTMIAYDVIEAHPDASGTEANTWTQFNDDGQPGDEYLYEDERVAA